MLRNGAALVRTAALFFLKDRCLLHASGLAFGAVFSLPPAFVVIIAVSQQLFGGPIVESQIIGRAAQTVGPQSALALDAMVRAARENTERGHLGAPIAWALLIGTACAVFFTVQDSLSLLWAAEPAPPRSLPHAIRAQLLFYAGAFALALGTLLGLTLDAVTMIALTAGDDNGNVSWPQNFGVAAVSFIIFFVLVAALFRYLPNLRVPWRDIFPGAIAASALFVAAQGAIGSYFRLAAMQHSYGPAASLLALMMWIFFTAVIFYFGAEITKARLEARKRTLERAAQIASEMRARPFSAPDPPTLPPGGRRRHVRKLLDRFRR